MSKHLFSLLCLLLTCTYLWAQETKKITGTVSDAATGEALIGVSIVEEGTTMVQLLILMESIRWRSLLEKYNFLILAIKQKR